MIDFATFRVVIDVKGLFEMNRYTGTGLDVHGGECLAIEFVHPLRHVLHAARQDAAHRFIAGNADRAERAIVVGDHPPCQDSCRLELKNFRGPETTKMNTYSPERKAALIARMMPPHNQSVVQLA
ncbi:hypothetical protein, partial [Serratia ficaria]